MTWLRVAPARWATAWGAGATGPFLGEVLLPYLAEDVLASTLALAGGPLPSLAYRGMLQGYQWLFPILPQLPWTVTAFVGTMVPALSLYGFQAARATSRGSGRRDLSPAWAVLGTAVVALIWFNVGLFGVRPTLISGDSMHPALQAGDVAVIQEVSPTEIQVGDVVRFQYQGVHVVHRVIEVRQTQEGLIFITQGDANNQIDPPVPADRIDGKVVFVIRKVGWIGIKVKQAMQGAT
jgi:signal peptidase